MAKVKIALTDDWELRGNGSGDVREMQVKPALQLMDAYEKIGIKNVFNIEVCQQLAFCEHSENKDILDQARAWDETVKEMYARGHGVELHLHPQWHNAHRVDNRWILDRKWNLCDYSASEVDRFFKTSIDYLSERLPDWKPFSFRAGSWGVAPSSHHIFFAMKKYGIQLDISLAEGIFYDGDCIDLDYTNLESPHLPFHPHPNDFRKVSRTRETVICVPTQTVLLQTLTKSDKTSADIKRKWNKYVLLLQLKNELKKIARGSFLSQYFKKSFMPTLDPFGFSKGSAKHPLVLDFSSNISMDIFFVASCITIERALRFARQFECPVPIVFENHTKDLSHKKIEDICLLIEKLRERYKDSIEFTTLRNFFPSINPDLKFHTYH